jgi:hypothetical protein
MQAAAGTAVCVAAPRRRAAAGARAAAAPRCAAEPSRSARAAPRRAVLAALLAAGAGALRAAPARADDADDAAASPLVQARAAPAAPHARSAAPASMRHENCTRRCSAPLPAGCRGASTHAALTRPCRAQELLRRSAEKKAENDAARRDYSKQYSGCAARERRPTPQRAAQPRAAHNCPRAPARRPHPQLLRRAQGNQQLCPGLGRGPCQAGLLVRARRRLTVSALLRRAGG